MAPKRKPSRKNNAVSAKRKKTGAINSKINETILKNKLNVTQNYTPNQNIAVESIKVQENLKVELPDVLKKENLSIVQKDIEGVDVFYKILQSKQRISVQDIGKERQICSGNFQNLGTNIVHCLFQERCGMKCPSRLKLSKRQPVIDIINDLSLYRVAAPFDRRCTSLDWHPTNPDLLAVGSKAGDIILWNIHNIDNDIFIQGRGPGGSISAMKFNPSDPNKLYIAALDGKLSLQDLQRKSSNVYLDTMTWDYWFCSLDIQPNIDVMVTGENSGKLTLLSMKEGQKIWTHKIHKDKITHTEFSPREPWLLCTASTDRSCKLWDIRMVKNKNSYLCSLPHERPINSAYFSLTDGTRLLTTDQNSEIRIYTAPNFLLERKIHHPHRFFQHITPIKANWHPLQDLIVIGRYPDKKFPGWTESEARTVDVFCAESGDLVRQIDNRNAPGIISLNKFGHFGDTLASTMGVNILIWRQSEDIAEKQEKLMTAMNNSGTATPRTNTSRTSNTSHQGPRKSKLKNTKMKVILKQDKKKQ